MELNDDNCKKCKQKINEDEPFFCCDSCLAKTHKECSLLSSSEVKCMPLQKRILIYICNDCRALLARMPYIIKMIEELKNDVKEIKQFHSICKPTNEYSENTHLGDHSIKPNYAKVLKEGVVVVKPTKPGINLGSKEKVKRQVDPAELGIGIKNMKETKDGAVIIKVRNEEEANKLKSSLEPKIRADYQTTVPIKKNPRFKIVGIEEQYDEETFISKLKQQNPEAIGIKSEIKIIVMKKMVKTFLAIIECDPSTFSRVMSGNEGRLFIGCRSCRCFEYIQVFRCYKCNKYGHKASDCKGQKTCGRCGNSDHETKDCKLEPECINCRLHNDINQLNLSTSHTSFDIKCATYLRYQERERQKIQYSSMDK